MKKNKVETHFHVSKQQLEGLLEYMEMYGVETMKFKRRGFAEALENFGPVKIPCGTNCPMGRYSTFTKGPGSA
jgi:hypothetical protein